MDFDVADRINIYYECSSELEKAIKEYEKYIKMKH
jgi:hypothetical protein